MTASSLEDFYAEFVRDRERGQRKSVEEYVQAYPGFETAIRGALTNPVTLSANDGIVEAVIATCLAHLDEGDEKAVQAVLDEFPECAPEVRRRLEALGSSGVLDASPSHPKTIGPYKILGVLGEGGMGTVYLAEQRQPVTRRVAVKLIKVGMDTKEVLARFELERQALAMMEHDNIARVLEAGATETGHPFFVMEYVKGIPITEHCDQSRESVEARLRLFQLVCSAVQHAHNKGVMHRDLTPRNILVAVHDGTAVPKIIDFGLARATHQRLVEKTVYTEQGRIVGTPGYMSPEQAGLGGQDVDSRTDVYSLGVILYELLVGEPPFTQKHLLERGFVEMQRIIREEDPPRPSTKFSTREHNDRLARERRTDVNTLLRKVRGDLDWIAMKAMEKDRNRRYETVADLSRDVERFLKVEAVAARPPSAGYRLRKFVRKHKATVASVVLVTLSLLAGVVAFAIENQRARANERFATKNWQEAERERTRADEKAKQARRLADEAMRVQSLFLADLANQQTDAGRRGHGIVFGPGGSSTTTGSARSAIRSGSGGGALSSTVGTA